MVMEYLYYELEKPIENNVYVNLPSDTLDVYKKFERDI